MAIFTLQGLHDEIEADPLTLGYKEVGGEWKEDSVIASLINSKDYIVDAGAIATDDIRAGVTYEAYNTLLADRQEWLTWMTPGDSEFRITADMKLNLTGRTLAVGGVAGVGSDDDSFWAAAHEAEMCSVMLGLIEADGSRAEVLWGQGKVVSISEIAHAANV